MQVLQISQQGWQQKGIQLKQATLEEIELWVYTSI